MSIASASTTVKFHEFPSGTVVHNYQPGSQIDGPIRSISWSKDGNWLALVPFSGLVEIVSVKDQLKLLHTIQEIEGPSCAAFQTTTKKNIAVGTKSGQVLIYDIKSRGVKKRFNNATSPVSHIEFTLKDNHIVSASGSGEAFIYSNVSNVLSSTFKVPRSQSISALRTSPIKRNYVVAGSNEGVVAVWDINGNKSKFCVGSHKAPVTAVAFSPANLELLASSGLDRQFCCYDIGIGKCIANIYVENNITAIDFSPDGNFIVMASQKGRIYIYDFKNLQTPIQSFAAHSGAVKHLSFRKTDDFESNCTANSSIFDNQGRDNPTPSTNTPRNNNESFDLYIGHSVADHENNTHLTSVSASNAQDSFMADLGFDKNNTAESYKNDSFKTSENPKKLSMTHKFTPTHAPKQLQELQSGSKTRTSTPNYLSVDINTAISPIVDNQEASPQVLLHCEGSNLQSGLENLVKSTIKTELKSVAEELKSEMKYYSTHNLAQSRQMCLDMIMSMVKEFIKVENNFNSLRSELAGELGAQGQSGLVEENLMLRQRVALLEEEVAMLKGLRVNRQEYGGD